MGAEFSRGPCLRGVRRWRIVHRGFDFSFRFRFPLARMRCIPIVLLPQHQAQVSVCGRRRPPAAAFGLGSGGVDAQAAQCALEQIP